VNLRTFCLTKKYQKVKTKICYPPALTFASHSHRAMAAKVIPAPHPRIFVGPARGFLSAALSQNSNFSSFFLKLFCSVTLNLKVLCIYFESQSAF